MIHLWNNRDPREKQVKVRIDVPAWIFYNLCLASFLPPFVDTFPTGGMGADAVANRKGTGKLQLVRGKARDLWYEGFHVEAPEIDMGIQNPTAFHLEISSNLKATHRLSKHLPALRHFSDVFNGLLISWTPVSRTWHVWRPRGIWLPVGFVFTYKQVGNTKKSVGEGTCWPASSGRSGHCQYVPIVPRRCTFQRQNHLVLSLVEFVKWWPCLSNSRTLVFRPFSHDNILHFRY